MLPNKLKPLFIGVFKAPRHFLWYFPFKRYYNFIYYLIIINENCTIHNAKRMILTDKLKVLTEYLTLKI